MKQIKIKDFIIESWYDYHTRNYITQLKDKNGNQIGDAEIDGNKSSRDVSVTDLIKKVSYEINSNTNS